MDLIEAAQREGVAEGSELKKPLRTHKSGCGYNYGHDCDCGGTLTHASNCNYNYGHDCDCGLDKQQGVAEGSLEEYGNTAKGQKMLGKVHNRAADRVTSKQADKDPEYARKAQQTQDRAWDRLAVKEQGVAEEPLEETNSDAISKIEDLFRK